MLKGLRSLRSYSTNGSGDKPVFLSDLLQRVQKINLNVGERSERPKPNRFKAKTKLATTSPKTQGKKPAGKKSSSPTNNVERKVETKDDKDHKLSRFSVADVSIIDIAGHPLVNNTRRFIRDTTTDSSRPTGSFASRSKSRTRTRTNQPNAKRPNGGRFSRPLKMATVNDSITLSTKTIQPLTYKPSLTNSFIYGKSTNFQINLTSRITSVIKNQLLKSNYPYKLPKSIIDNAPKDPGNKFLVNSNYTTDINQQDLINDINEKVKGKLNNLNDDTMVGKKINQNPTLNLDSKNIMMNVIKSKSLSNVFDGAHWRQ